MKSRNWGLAAAGVALAVVTACGGGGSSSPPTAKSVLQSDGYAYDAALSAAAQSSSSMPAGTASEAVGTKGDSIQIAIVFSDQALANVGYRGAVADLAGKGLTVSQNGDTVTATGPSSAFSNLG